MISYIEEISIGHRMKLFNLLYNLRLELQAEDKWNRGLCHCILQKTRGNMPDVAVMQFTTYAFYSWPEGSGTVYPIKVRTFTRFKDGGTQYHMVGDPSKLDWMTSFKTYFLRVRFTNKRKRLLDYMIKILAESIGEKMQ